MGVHDPVIEGHIVTREESEIAAGLRAMIHQAVRGELSNYNFVSKNFMNERISHEMHLIRALIPHTTGLIALMDDRIRRELNHYRQDIIAEVISEIEDKHNPPLFPWWRRLFNWFN